MPAVPEAPAAPVATPDAAAPSPAPAAETPAAAPPPPSAPTPTPTSSPSASPTPEVPPQPQTPTPQPETPSPEVPQPPEPVRPPQESAQVSAPAPVAIKDRLYAALEKIRFRKRAKLDKIMGLAAKKKSIKNDDVEKLLRVSDSTAQRYLKQLVQEGRLTASKRGNDASYEPR